MMSPLNHISQNILFLFLSFSCLALSQPTQNTTVLDVDGNQLQRNTNYYVMPLHDSNGVGNDGGLALSAHSNPPCPHNVIQENDQNSVGLSLRIFPVDKNQQAITLSSDVNIVFWAATICVQSTAWQLGDVDPITRRRYVRSGGVVGRPGPATVKNWFRMERYGEGYKIVFCPSVCSSCRVACGDVGVFVENGRRWLGLNGQPLVIVFKKS